MVGLRPTCPAGSLGVAPPGVTRHEPPTDPSVGSAPNVVGLPRAQASAARQTWSRSHGPKRRRRAGRGRAPTDPSVGGAPDFVALPRAQALRARRTFGGARRRLLGLAVSGEIRPRGDAVVARFLREAEDALAEDVLLHLVGAAVDRRGLGEH